MNITYFIHIMLYGTLPTSIGTQEVYMSEARLKHVWIYSPINYSR